MKKDLFGIKSGDLFYKIFNNQNLIFKTYNNKEYPIKANRPNKRIAPYDLSINIGNRILAIIEFNQNKYIHVQVASHLEEFASKNNIRYVVLSDGDRFFVSDQRDQNIDNPLDFEGFCNLLMQHEKVNIDQSITNIINVINKTFLGSQDFNKLTGFVNETNKVILNEIEYDEVEQYFSFSDSTNINNYENRLFRSLLEGDEQIKKIYRYTTLSTIFSMLTYNSFRMNGLVGMNDTTEVNYADNYVFGTNRDFAVAPWQTIDSYNRRFISSCSLKNDDLTQWRLYADDCKGVSLVFNVKNTNYQGHFEVKKINYGEVDKSHKALDLIKNFIDMLKTDYQIEFRLKTFNTWKHFFKPFDYKVEEEIRILFIQQSNNIDVKNGWMLTNSHNILNPFVEFKLNDLELPVYLNEIILGPKCPEKEINKRQFEQLIRDLKKRKIVIGDALIDEFNIDHLTVSLSKINNYR